MDLQGNIHVGCCKNTRKASCKAQAVRRSSDLPVVIAGFRSSPVLAWSRLSARNPMFTSILEHTICNSVDPLERALYLCYFIIENKTFYFFPRGHGNESCNLIGSERGPNFHISDHGHGNGGKKRG